MTAITRYSVCPADGEPLVTAMDVPGNEWKCMVCCVRYPMFGVPSSAATPELHARYAELLELRRAELR